MIVRLDEAPVDNVGGKAANLMKLASTFRVPTGFVISADDSSVDDDVLRYFDQLGAEKVAVRSSAVHEDGKDSSWAGQFDTYLNVDRSNLLEKIRACRSSTSTTRAQAYATMSHGDSGSVAVIVQAMLTPRASGVAFSHHPVTKEHVTVIEAVAGLGEKLVSGEVIPDTYICSDPLEKFPSDQKCILTDDEIQKVDALTQSVEEFFEYPVDVEWAFERDILYVLQARPITTL